MLANVTIRTIAAPKTQGGEGGEVGHSAETGRQAVDISPNVPCGGKGAAYFKLKGPAREGVIQDI